MVKTLYILLIVVISLWGCKKAEDRSCFKSIGDQAKLDTVLTAFDTLKLYDDIKYYLVPDSVWSVRVEGGANLIKHVGINIENGVLTISNKNKCGFLRKIDEKLKVFIHGQDVNYIHYEGSEKLHSTDTLHASELRLFIRDGAGDVDLTVENGYTSAEIAHGWGNFTLRGKSLSAYLSCSTNSYCDTRSLKVASYLHVNSNTQGDMYVNVENLDFRCSIHQKGNVYYEGEPSDTDFEYHNEGDIIHLTN